ncbi:DNA-binding SARP family transcriptional activator [Branchiibius hedensis]|uniref:DNA-binding transcriptional activator of the SARP family n=1 Tax=Branchiibius hedensis TaxID=672460 RepID=A0A2Y8ZQY2_9MICO|nr:BTAD domain-containing putative transcriptional regulator [Branchiibius hedensis]PWJ25011.1 DNA-binding SARP family transcriptional activator [Branchiibius hedensis]SSA33826.1 DNA-binding transcriptional activator of the SARP family [Branchiibius hedensis]
MDELYLLGGVRLTSPGSPSQLPLGGAQQQGLLAMLALASPRALTVSQLIDGLWGSSPPRSARNAIQVRINGLRKSLAPTGLEIETIAGGYALRGQVVIDTARVRTLLERGRAEFQAGRPGRAAAAYREATELCRGALCSGLEDHFAFLPAAVAEFDARRVDALLGSASAELANGSPEAAAASAAAVLQERPYDETAWSVHLQALYHQGRQVEALEGCRRLRRILSEELGIDPGRAIRSLEQDILNHSLPPVLPEPMDQSSPSEAGAALPELPNPFVGREALVERVARTIADGARLVTLVGMGGMGKSVVAAAVGRRLAEQGIRVAYGTIPSEIDDRSALFVACQSAGLPANNDPALTLASFDGLVILDGVRAGPIIAALIGAALGQPGHLRLLVTSREALAIPAEYAIRVEPLRRVEDSAQLFIASAQRRGAELDPARDGAAIAEICARLDGIPLGIELAGARTRVMSPTQFAERLRRGEASVLGARRGGVSAAGTADLKRVVEDAIAPVLGTHGEVVLQLLASCSGGLSLDLLERLAEGRDLLLEESLSTLLDRGLCQHDDDGRLRLSGPVAEFARGLGHSHDADSALAEATAQLAESLVDQLQSSSAGLAIERLEGDSAALDVAMQRAFELGDTKTVTRLTTSLHRYWLMTGRLVPASRALARCVELTSGAKSAWFQLLQGTFAGYRHQPEAFELLAGALQTAQDLRLPPDRVHVNAWCTYSALAAESEAIETALCAADQARELAALSGSPELISLARDLAAFVRGKSGDTQVALDLRLECLAELRTSGTAYDLAAVLVNAADDLAQLGRPAEGLAFADEALVVMPPGATRLATAGLLGRGQAQALLRDTAAAEGTCLAMLAGIDDPNRDPVALADGLTILAACLAMRGDDQRAARASAAATTWYAENDVSPERVAAPLRAELASCAERLASSHATYGALGATDPEATVRRLLGTM